ncbi:MAG: SIS domain-containing protein [Candidatus Marinimicrobia bacterium]|nr:SIS domain-containing protein [Candidatus Neomarinimicrobiota bacterium]MCF7829361.1 SIS domain-containing protein [Candidatus Neomarinimicrobiota bacterium]MCF7880847.1 SIS domain-containing protein [Candidatus Neomarinimicrobiota bacterium]
MNHYTLQEINSQVQVWEVVLDLLDQNKDKFTDQLQEEKNAENLFIGCGTSYYLALSAASVYAKITGEFSRAYPASDVYLFSDPVFPNREKSFVPFLISRSGTTSEVLWVAKYLKEEYNLEFHGVSCREESELLELSDNGYLIAKADEKSVVMTRSFTSMLLMLQSLAGLKVNDIEFLESLRRLPEIGKRIFRDYNELPETIINEGNFTKFVYLGQGPFYGLASESMLKIKEMSLTCSEAYHSLEFRHGPKSIADENMLVTFFISENAKESEVKLIQEVRELGAKVLAICESSNTDIDTHANYVVELKSGVDDYARLPLYMPITQLLGYYQAVSKDLDPDKPTNLSQVVEI